MKQSTVRIIFALQFLIAVIFVMGQSSMNPTGLGISESGQPKSNCQNDPKKDRLWGLDLRYLGISVHGADRIKNDFFIGGEFGLLPNKFDRVLLAGKYFTQKNTKWSRNRSDESVNGLERLLYLNAFARWKPKIGWAEMDAGLSWVLFSRSGYDVDDLGLTSFLGLFAKPMLGFDKLKLGIQFDFGHMKGGYYGPKREFVIISSPFVRINFR